MTKRMLLGLVVGLRLLALPGGQAANDGVITINGGRNTILMRTPSEPFVPAVTAVVESGGDLQQPW